MVSPIGIRRPRMKALVLKTQECVALVVGVGLVRTSCATTNEVRWGNSVEKDSTNRVASELMRL